MHLSGFYYTIFISFGLTTLIYVNQIKANSLPVVLWHGMGKKNK